MAPALPIGRAMSRRQGPGQQLAFQKHVAGDVSGSVALGAKDSRRDRDRLNLLSEFRNGGRKGVRLPGLEVDVAEELGEAVGTADVVSCATTATEPIVRGRWLTPGHHLDLVGAFTPTMMEADADAVLVCDVVVDDREAAADEAGDLISACRRGWSFDRVRADLAELLDGGLVRGTKPTLFKSVGLALEDLAVARLLAEV